MKHSVKVVFFYVAFYVLIVALKDVFGFEKVTTAMLITTTFIVLNRE